MNGKALLSRRMSATAYAAMVIATSLGSVAAAEARESRAIESIDRYCRASWRNARIDRQDWEECTQQTFVELLDRVSQDRWIEAIENHGSSERRELNRSIWRVAQRWRRAPRPGNGVAEMLAQAPANGEPGGQPGLGDVLQVLSSPEAGLSARQREIMRRWIAGHSVSEIAADLDLPSARVSDEKYKAIRKLRSLLA
ncbi:MAG: sigma-70 family RNA polymerase sigma factor [Planctomycetaceae bacterium]|jgi:DNA-binding CsgD family transcriptional regulator|nr:sigma-70 family RNA polymerase sigma factor [Planctomycetaceae bacterium]